VFVAIYMCGRWCVLHAIIPLKPLRYELGIRQQSLCPGVLLGKFAEFTEHLRLTRPRRAQGGTPDTGANG